MELTIILYLLNDIDNAWVSEYIPPFDAAYASEFGSRIRKRVDAILMMRPELFNSGLASLCFASVREVMNMGRRLISSTLSNSSTVMSRIEEKRLTPAL